MEANNNLVSSKESPVNFLSTEQILEFSDKPLRQIPAEWRPMAWEFWAYWSNLLPNQLALCTRLRIWHAAGLTIEDARTAFGELTEAAESSEQRFAGDLLAELAAIVARKLKRRRILQEQMAAREDGERAKTEKESAAQALKQALMGIGNPSS